MPIFMNDPTQRGAITGPGDIGQSNPWAQLFTERLQSKMSQWGEASKTKTMELTSGFNPFQLTNVREQRQEAQLKEAQAASGEALQAIGKASQRGGPIKSLSQLVQKRSQKLQSLQKARKSLEQSKKLYEFSGVDFKYESTGYNPFTPEASSFEEQFDTAIEQRKQQYAEMYGYGSFGEMYEGYGLTSEGTADVGQRDILDMIMSDITGMSYEDLAMLNTINLREEMMWDPNYGQPGFTGPSHIGTGRYTGQAETYTQDQMAALRDFFVSSNLQAYEAANKRAAAEETFRQQAAMSAREQAIKGGKAVQKQAGKEIGKSLEDVQLQIRELDEDFMKKLTSFQTGPRKKKVRSVSFDEGRPQ